MPDWTRSMEQTFEYYIVDPETWKDTERLDTVKKCVISWDREADTLGSASIDIVNSVGECYVRAYLITIQKGITERHPLGTFLVQTPCSSFDGKLRNVTMDAYTSLLELKENPPPIGYSILKGENIMDSAYRLVRENIRAPVVKPSCNKRLYDDFVANTDDNWLTFNSDLIANAKYEFDLDEIGRVLFVPIQDTASLQPVCTFDDGNSSILYPNIDIEHDMYEIPNVVEVVYSRSNENYYAKAVNDDPNSPVSTVNRGRIIGYRVTDPDLAGDPTEAQIQEYAERVLREVSTLEYTVTFSHGYRGNRVGDCVRLNYERAGLVDIKAKTVSQTIYCEAGCKVTEKAVFTVKLWG